MEALRGRRGAWRAALLGLLGLGAAAALWPVLAQLGAQLFGAYVCMGAALPLCRRLEKRLSPSLAAGAAFALLALGGAGALLLILPALARQFGQLSQALPELLAAMERAWQGVETQLARRGLELAPLREDLTEQARQLAGRLLPRLAQGLGHAASGLGNLMIIPLLAFYLLRDRRQICAALTLLVPVRRRRGAVLAAREMRREVAGFLRGQLLLSALVGALTALGLLLVGSPSWLALGFLMGVMELIPYVGPLLAGIPAVLLGLSQGWSQGLWTLAVLVGVQQLEGGVLSPRLLSGATKLSPLAVLLAISAGGLAGGALGMILALPVVVALRGACRALRTELSHL